MTLRNKQILITAGPTWVAIDKVRVISNLATGETGIILAKKLNLLGARVTLLLGQVKEPKIPRRIRLIRYRFFEELASRITKELKTGKYDIIIHAAAVCDYRPSSKYDGKIHSGLRKFQLKLEPTPKIIDTIKRITKRKLVLVGFKYEPDSSLKALIKESKKLILRANADIVIGNSYHNKIYRALIVEDKSCSGPYKNKTDLASKLIKELNRIN